MFKVWDKVRIKSREQMEGMGTKEIVFLKSMIYLCWRTAEISEINYETIELINWSNDNEVSKWEYTTDMIELVEENKTEPERTPTPWEYVEVSDDNIIRYKRKYTVTINNKYHCVGSLSEEDYNEWTTYSTEQRRYIRLLQTKQTYTIEATEEQYKKIQELIA